MATALSANTSSTRRSRALADDTSRNVMWLRSISDTGRQQLTAIAIASAPTSTTPAIGWLRSQRSSPFASVMKARTISANSPSTDNARVLISATRCSRASELDEDPPDITRSGMLAGDSPPHPPCYLSVGTCCREILTERRKQRLVARVLGLPLHDDRFQRLVPFGGLLFGGNGDQALRILFPLGDQLIIAILRHLAEGARQSLAAMLF